MSDNIKVVVKVRPLISREVEEKLSYRWRVKNENILIRLDQNGKETEQCFTFDKVYDMETKTSQVYEDVAKPIVEAAIAGFNGTIFAYGQTSSGKTYTMSGTDTSPGIITLAVRNLFEIIKSMPDRDFLVRVSYIEIYNDTLKDLLCIEKKKIKIHDTLQGVKVDVFEKVTSTPEEVLEAMKEGEANRMTGATNMNEESSRSHSIFQITIESREHVEDEEEGGCVNVSQLNLVDLAGSERSGQAGATGIRLKEGTHINKSLSALALVIMQLSEDPNRYANYRDSKLTRILQNSLGGNAKTSIICAITPASDEETISTLQFANRAKVIKNRPEVNAVATNNTMIQSLTKQLGKLQAQLEAKRNLEVMLEKKTSAEQELQKQITNLRKLIINGFEKRTKKGALRRMTISTVHNLHEQTAPAPPTIPRFCTPTLKYNPMAVSMEFAPIQGVSRLPSVPEENRLVTPPPRDKEDSNEVIEIDSDDEKATEIQKDPNACSPYHHCYRTLKTPPCVLRKNAKQAEKNLRDIVELTEREKIYTPSVVELMEKLEENAKLIGTLNEEIDSLKDQSSQKDSAIEELKAKINKTEEEVKSVSALKSDLESKCKEYYTKIMDCEVTYENLLKKSKSREDDLLSLLEEQKKIKAEDLGKLNSFMDMSLVKSDSESSIMTTTVQSNGDNPTPVLVQDLCQDMEAQLSEKNKTILELESTLILQRQKIEALESMAQQFQMTNNDFINKLTCIENENSFLKSTIDTLHSTIECQKNLLEAAQKDIKSYNSTIQELQIKLVKKDTPSLKLNETMIEALISDEQALIANNDNIRNIIVSLKTALDDRTKEVEHLKTSLNTASEISNNYISLEEQIQEKEEQISQLIKEAENMQDQITENVRVINKFMIVKEELTNDLASTQQQNEALKEQSNNNKEQITSLKSSNDELTRLVAEKEIIERNLATKNEQLKQQVQDMTERILTLEKDLITKEKNHLIEGNLVVSKLLDTFESINAKEDTLPITIDSVGMIFHVLENKLETLDSAIKKYTESIKFEKTQALNELESKFSTVTNAYNTELANLKLRFKQSSNEQIQELERKLIDANKICQNLRSDLLDKENKISILQKQNSEKELKIQEKDVRIKDLTDELDSIEGSFKHLIHQKDSQLTLLEEKLSNAALKLDQKCEDVSMALRQTIENRNQMLLEILEKTTKLTKEFDDEAQGDNCSDQAYDQILIDLNRIRVHLEFLKTENSEFTESSKKEVAILKNTIENKNKLLHNILNKATNLIQECGNGDLFQEVSSDNLYEQIITALDKIGNRIAVLQNDTENVETTLQKYEKEITVIKDDITKKDNTLLNIFNKCAQLVSAFSIKNMAQGEDDNMQLNDQIISHLANISKHIDLITTENTETKEILENYSKQTTDGEHFLNIFNKTAKLLRCCCEQSITEEYSVDNAYNQIMFHLDEIMNHMTNLKIEITDLSSTKDMVEKYQKETTLLKKTIKERNTFLQDILRFTNKLTKEWNDTDDGTICVENIEENVYEGIHRNINKIVDHITHLNAEMDSIKLLFRKKFEGEEIALTEVNNKNCLLREIITRAKRMNPENYTKNDTDETSSDLRREITLVFDNIESYIKTLNSEKDKLATLLDEKIIDFQKTTQENIKAYENDLTEILNKCLTLTHICDDGKSLKDTTCDNKLNQILLIVDKLATYISLLKTKNDVERSDIEEMLKRALKEIEHLNKNNFSLMNELTRQTENCETLKRENVTITTLMKQLVGTNEMLTRTVNYLQPSSSETETIESDVYQVEDLISRKYVADDQDSEAIHQSPHSLVSLCLNKINGNELLLESFQTSSIRNCVETQTESDDDKSLTTDVNQMMAENIFLKNHFNELESTIQWLLQEREEVQKEINLLLEPAGELQKRIANHRTNLSTLTATTYAENKLLHSQLKVLKHHHTRYTTVCQRDLPGFKSQLNDLMSILKGRSSLDDKQNASVKRYSLPDVLDDNTSVTTFTNDSTLDGDLLMLDTNLTLTSADNTLRGTQTCLDVTQTNFDNETTAVNVTIEVLTNDNKKMLEQLETLRLENLKLKDEIHKSTKPNRITEDVQLSPIKKSYNSDWVSAIPQARCDKCVNLQTKKHELTIENKRLIDELERIAEEKKNIDKMYNNLSLERPSSDVLARKLFNIEKDYQSKLQEINKLTNDLNKNKKMNKELQQENETLSVQLMEYISDVDNLKKELDCQSEAKAELEEKLLSLLKRPDTEPNKKITCSDCKMKDEMIKTFEEKQLSKINRSLSDSDSSMRYNKICTLQNELHASKEDCKKITEEVATIKNQLERSNVSTMDMDESVGDSNIFALTKGFDTSETTKSKACEDKSKDVYEIEQNDCLNFYLEKTGVDKENIQSNIKIIDIMKMLYNNLIAKHGNEVDNLLNKLKDFEEPKNHLQTKLLNVSEEYVKIAQSLEHNNETVKKVMNALSKVKENTNRINDEMDNIPDTEKNTKLVALFKENLLKVLDTEFGLSFMNIFESLIDSIVNKHQNDLSGIMCEYTKLQAHMETVAAEFHSVNENLLQMKSQLSDKEKEYNLLKAQKEKINEISNAVTLDIINREKKMTETFTKGCEKLMQMKIIAPFDTSTTIPVNENIQQLFERILSNNQTYLEIEKEKQGLAFELDELKIIIEDKENYISELQFERENNLLTKKSLEDKNKAHVDTIEALIKEVTILKEDMHQKDNVIKSLEQKINASKDFDVSIEKYEAKDLIAQLENLKQEHENLKTINDMINAGNEQQIEELEKARELINKYKTELDDMTSDILVLRESVNDNVSIIETLTQDAKSLMEKNEQLNRKFAEKTEECLRLEMNIKTHEKSAEIQSKMILRLQKQKEEAESIAKETGKKLEDITDKHTALQRECDKLSENLKVAKGEIEGLKIKKETLELRVSELEAELLHDGHRRRLSVEAIAENARRRRQSIHDSQRIFEEKPDDHHKMEEMFSSRAKPDDLFMEVDGDNSNRSSPIRLSKGRDSFPSRHDQCDSGEDGSRPSSVARTRLRRQSIYDMHRYTEEGQSPVIMKPDSTTNDSELSQLREQLQACQQELEDMKEKYRELDDECETCAQYLREREDQCRQLKKDKSALERLVAELNDKLKSGHSLSDSKPSCQHASVNTDEDWANLHSVVVDRMSFDAEVEKNKRLSRAIDELRANKQELKNTIAKMQRALDKYVGYRETKELEATRAELAATRQELSELQERYRELDEECETCGQYLRDRDEQCRKLREAKRALEVRLAELEGSPSGAMQSAGRRRRQTQHDRNRQQPRTASAGTETCEDFLSYQVERDDSSSRLDNTQAQEMKRIKMTLDKVMKEKSALESQLLAASHHNPVFVATGSAIVQNQQLTDVMKENQKLKKMNAKLITICKKRNKSFEVNRENEEPTDVGI